MVPPNTHWNNFFWWPSPRVANSLFGIVMLRLHSWRRITTGAIGLATLDNHKRYYYAAAGAALVTSTMLIAHADSPPVDRAFTATEVAKHKTKDSRIWVSYNGSVYDVTDFVDLHPGGKDKIALAAGSALEPFWTMYTQHKKDFVQEIIAQYRIGRLDETAEEAELKKKNLNDPYANDPPRHPALVVRVNQPFNAEIPTELIPDNYITPNEFFFVRNHLPVPRVEEKDYRLEVQVEGKDEPLVSLSIQDLKTKFRKHNVIATIQCAGNRRSDMHKIKEVQGTGWAQGAISTAEWSGPRLVDVLAYAGVDFSDPRIQHLQFEGLDKDITGVKYGASIPLHKGIEQHGDVILAYEMNGVKIPLDHGFPVRVIVPGSIGARSVKWLSKIVASSQESPSHWQQKDYKCFNASTDWKNVDFGKAKSIQEFPVQSAICEPHDKAEIPEDLDEVKVRGYAVSGGGREIIRVDVSINGGKTWQEAQLLPKPRTYNVLGRDWAWTLWSVTVPVTEEDRKRGGISILCKAVDSSYNEQPESFQAVWNLRGLLATAWHSIKFSLKHEDQSKTSQQS
jgi:sulfite oxidase